MVLVKWCICLIMHGYVPMCLIQNPWFLSQSLCGGCRWNRPTRRGQQGRGNDVDSVNGLIQDSNMNPYSIVKLYILLQFKKSSICPDEPKKRKTYFLKTDKCASQSYQKVVTSIMFRELLDTSFYVTIRGNIYNLEFDPNIPCIRTTRELYK